MFDRVRFRRLAAAQWAERGREFAWFMAALVALALVMLVIGLSGKENYRTLALDYQGIAFLTGLIVTAPIFAARYFLPLSRKDAELTALMRPASVLEKFLLAFATVAVLYPIAYTVAFYLCDIPAALLAQSRASAAWTAMAPAARKENGFAAPERFGILAPDWGASLAQGAFALLFLLMALGWIVFGTLYFRRSPLLKTAAAGFGLYLLLLLVGEWTGSNSDRLYEFWHVKSTILPWQRVVAAAFWVVSPCLAWWSAYLALRDREAA